MREKMRWFETPNEDENKLHLIPSEGAASRKGHVSVVYSKPCVRAGRKAAWENEGRGFDDD